VHAFDSALVRGLGRAPQGLGTNYGAAPPNGIVPLSSPPPCKHWLRVFVVTISPTFAMTVHSDNVTVPGGLFDGQKVFNYYLSTVGVPPVFSWNGYLFKFEYTGGQNVIFICTDGMGIKHDRGVTIVSPKASWGSGAALSGLGATAIPLPPALSPDVTNGGPSGGLTEVASPHIVQPQGGWTQKPQPTSSPIQKSLPANAQQLIVAQLIAASTPQPVQFYAPPVASPSVGMPVAAQVAAGLLVLGLLAGAAYLILE